MLVQYVINTHKRHNITGTDLEIENLYCQGGFSLSNYICLLSLSFSLPFMLSFPLPALSLALALALEFCLSL